jgi:hypothetical protein
MLSEGTPPAASHSIANNTNKIQSTRMAITPGLNMTAGWYRHTSCADATPGGEVHPAFCTFVDFGVGNSDLGIQCPDLPV